MKLQRNKKQKYISCKRIAQISIGASMLFAVVYIASAQTMTGTDYIIENDSLNLGGGFSTSTTYQMEDTMGETATGASTSTIYRINAGYQQMNETTISLSPASDITLLSAIGGISGGTATGSTSVTVTTDNPAGYELSIKASSSPALVSNLDSFADYAPVSMGVPDFLFTTAVNSSNFGFSPEGSDIVTKYKDNGATCDTSTGDTVDRCWEGLSTANELIAKKVSPNHPGGTQIIIKFSAQSGASHVQTAGNYVATSTITAITL